MLPWEAEQLPAGEAEAAGPARVMLTFEEVISFLPSLLSFC